MTEDEQLNEVMRDLNVALEAMRRAGEIREHFQAGVLAALDAFRVHGFREDMARHISAARDLYLREKV